MIHAVISSLGREGTADGLWGYLQFMFNYTWNFTIPKKNINECRYTYMYVFPVNVNAQPLCASAMKQIKSSHYNISVIHFVLEVYKITDVLCVSLCMCTDVCMWDSQICWLSSISSISVGMYPIVLMHSPRSLQLMKPSLSLSNSLKASRSSVRKK